MIFISVDLPAPFSPISAWTVPGLIRRLDIVQRHHAGIALADAPRPRADIRPSPRRGAACPSGWQSAWVFPPRTDPFFQDGSECSRPGAAYLFLLAFIGGDVVLGDKLVRDQDHLILLFLVRELYGGVPQHPGPGPWRPGTPLRQGRRHACAARHRPSHRCRRRRLSRDRCPPLHGRSGRQSPFRRCSRRQRRSSCRSRSSWSSG